MSSDLFSFAADLADLECGGSLPPVDKWNPEYCGEIDIVIKRDGVWFHEGTPIGRAKLVRLFSTILKREGDEYFLVTPVEKMKITVEDVPFQAVQLEIANQGDRDKQLLTFRTNMGEQVTAGPDNRLIFSPAGEEVEDLIPYIHVRSGLNARLSRPVYYQLAELVAEDEDGVWSAGEFFPFAA